MRRPRDKIASSAGLSPTKVAASPTLQKNLGEVGCINWWKGHSSRWKRIIVFFKILDYISNSVALKLVSLAKNSMSLFCLPITSPNLIYHLLARLQGFLFFFFRRQCSLGFSNPFNTCISPDFSPIHIRSHLQRPNLILPVPTSVTDFSGSFM